MDGVDAQDVVRALDKMNPEQYPEMLAWVQGQLAVIDAESALTKDPYELAYLAGKRDAMQFGLADLQRRITCGT